LGEELVIVRVLMPRRWLELFIIRGIYEERGAKIDRYPH
jgi:hypothetical protein